MPQSYPGTHLRAHRKRAGLKLEEVAQILGYSHSGEVSRHEHLTSVPPFRAALQYEALYKMPISELFPAAFEQEKRAVEERLNGLLEALKESTATGREAALIARKFEWAWERENMQTGCLFHSHERQTD
jgi:transcriptional regulator with XRE-family HTH domain